MSKRAKVIMYSVAVTLLVALVLFAAHVAQPRIVAQVITPDGTALCVVQECNWNLAEWFTTYFVYRKPDSGWFSFPFDHEDSYWGSARVMLDTNSHTAVIYRGSSPTIRFDWLTESYTSHRISWTLPDGTRTNGWLVTNAPAPMPAGWNPSLYSRK
jgi:hypothetical protein